MYFSGGVFQKPSNIDDRNFLRQTVNISYPLTGFAKGSIGDVRHDLQYASTINSKILILKS